MKKVTLIAVILCTLSGFAFAGTGSYSGKEMKQTVQQSTCPQWYGDNEWNVSLWGAYAFGGADSSNTDFNFNNFGFNNGEVVRERSLLGDRAFGGGIDVKYFFHRYFGVGIEAFGLSDGGNNDNRLLNRFAANNQIAQFNGGDDNNGVGAVLATFTLRYPLQCSRISPYVWGGIGGIWGGRAGIVFNDNRERFESDNNNDGSVLGQVGGGLEVRFTQHIGLITDVSWNITDNEDFGMIRAGVNFAF